MVLNRLDSLPQAISFNEFHGNPDVSHIAISSPIGIDTFNAKNLFNRLSEEFTVKVPRKCQGAIQIEDDESFHWMRIVFSTLARQQDAGFSLMAACVLCGGYYADSINIVRRNAHYRASTA